MFQTVPASSQTIDGQTSTYCLPALLQIPSSARPPHLTSHDHDTTYTQHPASSARSYLSYPPTSIHPPPTNNTYQTIGTLPIRLKRINTIATPIPRHGTQENHYQQGQGQNPHQGLLHAQGRPSLPRPPSLLQRWRRHPSRRPRS